VLATYTGTPAHALRFERARHGKPYLVGHSIRFNLSHSGDLALIAVARDREVGVDVEAIRPERDVVGIARHFFAPGESEALSAEPPRRRAAAFYRCWTRKEAYMKACGLGLALRPDSFDVSLVPPGWHFVDLAVGDGYAAALVTSGTEPRVALRDAAAA
jgi:4'-phosphopantetheinyl transferase